MWALLKGGRVIDPASGFDGVADVLIRDGAIAEVGNLTPIPSPYTERGGGEVPSGEYEVLDLSGKVVCPGLIDMHVHLREPGFENKETIETGSQAAAAGGFTTIVCMPNTNPVIDSRALVEFVTSRAEEAGFANVLVAAAITKGLQGEQMAELGELAEAGAVAFTDDAFPVQNSRVMRLCMEYARMLDKPVLTHCEDKALAADGLVSEGAVATVAGLRGAPAAAEEIMVARNIMLAAMTGCRLHIQHVSTAGSVELIRQAKKSGLQLTCETCPQYFSLTDEAVASYDTSTKTNPPLRTARDVEAIKAGLADGTIDVIATDHAPHAAEDKEVEYEVAAFGMIGLETALGLVVTDLVKTQALSLAEAIAKMTVAPASSLGLQSGTLAKGAKADITIFDPDQEWVVRADEFKSKARNTPFEGWKLSGKVMATIANGRIVHGEEILDRKGREAGLPDVKTSGYGS